MGDSCRAHCHCLPRPLLVSHRLHSTPSLPLLFLCRGATQRCAARWGKKAVPHGAVLDPAAERAPLDPCALPPQPLCGARPISHHPLLVCAHPTTFRWRLPPLMIVKFPPAPGDCWQQHRPCCPCRCCRCCCLRLSLHLHLHLCLPPVGCCGARHRTSCWRNGISTADVELTTNLVTTKLTSNYWSQLACLVKEQEEPISEYHTNIERDMSAITTGNPPNEVAAHWA